jgi:hypothetical protein
MKSVTMRLYELSRHLQILSQPDYRDSVEEAVAKNDKKALLDICRKSNIPKAYRSSIVSIALSIDPKKFPITL